MTCPRRWEVIIPSPCISKCLLRPPRERARPLILLVQGRQHLHLWLSGPHVHLTTAGAVQLSIVSISLSADGANAWLCDDRCEFTQPKPSNDEAFPYICIRICDSVLSELNSLPSWINSLAFGFGPLSRSKLADLELQSKSPQLNH